MKLKLDDQNHVVVQDGKPVYVQTDGTEIAYDALSTVNTIARLNGEAKSNRERAETAEKTLKTFEGISDPEEARKALVTVGNLDSKKLIDAGEVDKVKAEVSKSYELKLADSDNRSKTLEKQLYDEMIGGNFARSKLISEKVAIPSDMVQARFGSAFKVEEGRVVAYDHTGNKIYSRARPGEMADFDEALEALIENYPHKESILKGSGASGGGATNSGTGSPNNKTIKQRDFDEMKPKDRAAKMSEGYSIIE